MNLKIICIVHNKSYECKHTYNIPLDKPGTQSENNFHSNDDFN